MDRKNLRKNLIKDFVGNCPYSQIRDISRELEDYQAHHIIPVEVLCELLGENENDLSETYNEPWNGILLPKRGVMAHEGSHGRYSGFIKGKVLEVAGEKGMDLDTAIRTVASCIKTCYTINAENLYRLECEGRIDNIEEYLQLIESGCRP